MGVVQPPPPMVVEQKEVVQPPTFAEQLEQMEALEEAPIAPSTIANWMAATVGNAENHTRFISTTVDDVISHCEEARLKLQEMVAVLVEVQEPGDAAELAAAVDVATLLVRDFFFDPDPRTAPLQEARRDLKYLVGSVIPNTRGNFKVYATARGLHDFPAGQAAVNHLVVLIEQAGGQAREAMQRLNYVALRRSYKDDFLVRVCSRSRSPTEAGLRVSTAVTSLQQTITDVDQVLAMLRAMRLNLVDLELAALNVAGVPDPPSP